MKKLLIALTVLLLMGCGACIKESELFQHDTVYKDWRHMWFSIAGYRNIDASDIKYSTERQWWGITKIYRGNQDEQKANPRGYGGLSDGSP